MASYGEVRTARNRNFAGVRIARRNFARFNGD